MHSLKHLACAYCAEETPEKSEILWRPEGDAHGIWDSTENLYQEVMFLNHLKVAGSRRATDVLEKCVQLVVQTRCYDCATKPENSKSN